MGSFFRILSDDPADYEDYDTEHDVETYDEYGDVDEQSGEYLEIVASTGRVALLPMSWVEAVLALSEHHILCDVSNAVH